MARAGRDPNNFEEWLRLADRKFKASRRVFDNTDPEMWIEAQGLLEAAVERLLKGFLCRHGRNGPELKNYFGHDIVRLCTEVASLEPKLDAFKDRIAELAQIEKEPAGSDEPCAHEEIGYNPYVVPLDTEEAGFFRLYEELRSVVVGPEVM